MAIEDLLKLKIDAAATARPHVVLIDDDDLVLSSLKIVLDKEFKVEGFTNPVDGFAAAVRPGVSLVVIDIKMPVHDGFWVYRKIRESGSKVPVVFNSAYQDAKMPAELAAYYQPFAYLKKSGSSAEFIQTIRDAVKAVR